MAPPIRKRKNFFSDNRRLISSTEISEHEQQQPMGSLVTAFGKRRSVRMAKKMNRRWICSDVLMDILPFFDRPQLGLKLALLSPRFNALVDTHFDGKTTGLTIWREIIVRKDKGPKPRLSVRIDGNFLDESDKNCHFPYSADFPLPDRPLPNNVRFQCLQIEYIDHSVLTFLHANKHIWYRSGTNLELFQTNDEEPIWDVLAREIWPIFAPSIRHLGFFDDGQFDELCRRISPTILTDRDQLVSIHFDQLILDVIADDGQNGTSVEQVLSEWLHTPRKDGKPKRLFCKDFHFEGSIAWLNSFKETFFLAAASANYQIYCGVDETTPIELFELVNERTNEKLTLTEEEECNWLLKRCPIVGETAVAVQWENAENWDEKLNCVKFNLFAAKNCIGPLSPPAEGPSGWAQQ